ncbi:aminotransferase class I/II-fold pyridoxal phosphate-dependent enzyme [Terasakiella sp. A23]|uniref:aminotransferase class I/II-fold pyridoxal phosphate-dependent enzyme n=1 Tax=Terasakiella sp. FCG-A23 TaxID=3080561 RepID=UPI0029533105|nr:aminotransferase class I/II-fold pyridoxal phosphate-dependent enzyme [Terasakiella sp. A23]MDV7340807.1 aminotransferase class I/II-fold pyridoxal phosphate-dependent enzyme [Terasakiella sp. A23]
MIPLAIPNMSGNEAKYLNQCIEMNFVSSVGPFVDQLEDMVATATGADASVVTSSGTDGLHVALLALGVQPSDLVIVPSYTFIASANAVSHCGAEPWLIDIDADSWTLNPNILENMLARDTFKRDGQLFHRESNKRVSAIVAVYTLGMPADMDHISEIAHKYGLSVLADAAAAFGSRYKNRQLADHGADAAVMSFNGNKTVTAGGGGAVIARDPKTLKKVKHITTTARVSDAYDHDMVGFNYRMTNLQAAVGCAQMEQLDIFVQAKKDIARRYNDALSGIEGVDSFPAPDWAQSACWFSGLLLSPPLKPVTNYITAMRTRDIAARPFWKPMHLQKPYQNCFKSSMDITDNIWPRILTLPCSTQLTRDEQDHVIASFLDITNQ